MIRFGVGLLVVGATGKMLIKTYRKIKKREFFKTSGLSKNFYKGAFENPMTRREAMLILGVREGTTPEKIKENHRKIMLINHPDNDGSTFLATKVNEAKELLLKST